MQAVKKRVVRRLPVALLLVAVLVAAGGTWLWAQGDMMKIVFRYQHVVSEKSSGSERVTTYSKATIIQEDSTFKADTVVQRTSGGVHTFTCTGNPIFTDPENTITSQTVTAYSSPRRAEFSDNVKMVSTPKKKSTGGDMKKEMSGEPSVITSDKLSYDYAGKVALATGNVVLKQDAKGRTVWADEARYEQKDEMVYLRGHVRMKNTGDGELQDVTNADTVTVSLANDWIDAQAKDGEEIEMILNVPKDDAPATGAKK